MSEHPATRNTLVPASPSSLAPVRRSAPAGNWEYLGFLLGGELYGFPLGQVREILKVVPITEVPRTPDFVLGILSVRGRITTVIDLPSRLAVNTDVPKDQGRILLVDSGEEVLGVRVDSVAEVFRFRENDVELSSVVGSDLSEYVYGIGRPPVRAPTAAERERLVQSPSAQESPTSKKKQKKKGSRAKKKSASKKTTQGSERKDDDIVILLDPAALLRSII